MPGTAVYIATTRGPVRIQQIRVDPQLRYASLGLNFTLHGAKLKDSYADFVGIENGLIGRFTREERYRTRISENIDGTSWHLAMFVAHALADRELLCQRESGEKPSDSDADRLGCPDHVIWATGELDTALNVHPVGEVETKLDKSAGLFAAAGARNIPVRILIPAASRTEGVDQAIDRLCARFPTLTVVFVNAVRFTATPWDATLPPNEAPRANEPYTGVRAGPANARRTKSGPAASTPTVSVRSAVIWASGGVLLIALGLAAGAGMIGVNLDSRQASADTSPLADDEPTDNGGTISPAPDEARRDPRETLTGTNPDRPARALSLRVRHAPTPGECYTAGTEVWSGQADGSHDIQVDLNGGAACSMAFSLEAPTTAYTVSFEGSRGEPQSTLRSFNLTPLEPTGSVVLSPLSANGAFTLRMTLKPASGDGARVTELSFSAAKAR